jgi:heme exporter protein D
MSNYDQIAWLPLCAGLTGLGLVLSYLVMRRRGLGSGLRGVALSLLPLAAYLTGAIKMLWKMGVAIGDFATGFVFSTRVWSGIALTALAVVLFIVSGPLRRRTRRGVTRQAEPAAQTTAARAPGGQLTTRTAPTLSATAKPTQPAPAKTRKAKAADDDDDLADVADILRRHGIT